MGRKYIINVLGEDGTLLIISNAPGNSPDLIIEHKRTRQRRITSHHHARTNRDGASHLDHRRPELDEFEIKVLNKCIAKPLKQLVNAVHRRYSLQELGHNRDLPTTDIGRE